MSQSSKTDKVIDQQPPNPSNLPTTLLGLFYNVMINVYDKSWLLNEEVEQDFRRDLKSKWLKSERRNLSSLIILWAFLYRQVSSFLLLQYLKGNV